MKFLNYFAHAVIISSVFAFSSIAAADAKAFDTQMNVVLESYFKIHSTLSSDSIEGVQEAAKQMSIDAAKLDASTVKGDHAKHYVEIAKGVQKYSAKFTKAKNIRIARKVFMHLSKSMSRWGKMSKQGGINVYYCSMSKGGWLQKTGKTQNPYYGSAMLTCGEKVI